MVNILIQDRGLIVKNVTNKMAAMFQDWLSIRENRGVTTQYDESKQTLELQDTNWFEARDAAHEYWYKQAI